MSHIWLLFSSICFHTYSFNEKEYIVLSSFIHFYFFSVESCIRIRSIWTRIRKSDPPYLHQKVGIILQFFKELFLQIRDFMYIVYISKYHTYNIFIILLLCNIMSIKNGVIRYRIYRITNLLSLCPYVGCKTFVKNQRLDKQWLL